MKIVNLDKGEAYQLNPDTQLSIERTNPFFNDYGEQSVPLSMPASDHNMRLLNYPTAFGLTQRVVKTRATISDGDYHTECTQALLSAQKKGSLQTSFYMNDGSLYAAITKVRLKEIFNNENVKDAQGNTITTVQQGIEFCRSLMAGSNPDYAIFPVLVDNDSGLDGDYNYKVINRWGKDVTSGDTTVFTDGTYDDASCDFWGAQQRTEYVDTQAVTLTPGYYITPFIRCNTVLKRIFQHFGYTLDPDNFFATTAPFTRMVFVNNVIDSLVNGTIRVSDLLPDVSASTIIDIYRKKFCCEFVADELTKTVRVRFLKDVLDATPDADLTQCMTEEPQMVFNTKYRRVVLKSDDQTDGDQEDGYDDLKSMVQKCPTAYFDAATGCFVRDGFVGVGRERTIIGGYAQPYDTGQDIDTQDITVPDMMPALCELKKSGVFDILASPRHLYIGTYATLNSKMVTTAEQDNDLDTAETSNLKPILAIPYIYQYPFLGASLNYARGTVNCYDPSGVKLWDYSLLYNGEEGLFNRFWSYADRLYRNALDDVKVKLLLPQALKSSLPSTAKVTIRNTPFVVNKLKFSLGGKEQPLQTELKTLRIMQPEDVAPTLQQLLPMQTSQYKWEAHSSAQEVSRDQYEASGADKERKFKVFYPPLPSAAYVGQQMFVQYCYTKSEVRFIPRRVPYDYTKYTVWLECVHV